VNRQAAKQKTAARRLDSRESGAKSPVAIGFALAATGKI
jgi:hypothetical protein